MASKKGPNPKRYGYVYHFIFTRPTDGREFHYIGQHVGTKVDPKYFGSGFRLIQMYRKYGRHGNVVRTGLMWCYSKYELDFAEIVFIATAKQLYGKDCLNLNYGGDGGRKAQVSVEKQRDSLIRFYESSEGALLKEQARRNQLGKSPSAETRAKLSAAGLGKKRSPETCERIGAIHRGRKRSKETRDRLVESWSTRPTVTCPHCNKSGSLNLMNRWHFDNCKALTGISRAKTSTTEKRMATLRSNPKTCPHCGLIGVGGNMTRYHFDNCQGSGWLL